MLPESKSSLNASQCPSRCDTNVYSRRRYSGPLPRTSAVAGGLAAPSTADSANHPGVRMERADLTGWVSSTVPFSSDIRPRRWWVCAVHARALLRLGARELRVRWLCLPRVNRFSCSWAESVRAFARRIGRLSHSRGGGNLGRCGGMPILPMMVMPAWVASSRRRSVEATRIFILFLSAFL